MRGKIAEIFDSLQGEGIYLGEKQLFVRLFGCNLNCRYCDTKLISFREYSPEELFRELKAFKDNYHSLVFTGGEPLLQKDFLKEALKMARARGYRTYLETNGVLAEELRQVISLVDIVAMDLKLPSSTGERAFWQEHRKFLEIAAQREVFLKSVVCLSTSEEDIRLAAELIKENNSGVVFVLQPNSFENGPELAQKLQNFKDLLTEQQIITCVIAQMHKIVGIR